MLLLTTVVTNWEWFGSTDNCEIEFELELDYQFIMRLKARRPLIITKII